MAALIIGRKCRQIANRSDFLWFYFLKRRVLKSAAPRGRLAHVYFYLREETRNLNSNFKCDPLMLLGVQRRSDDRWGGNSFIFIYHVSNCSFMFILHHVLIQM